METFNCIDILRDWQRFFQEIHKMSVTFMCISIPKADDKEFPWLVCVPKYFSIKQAFIDGSLLRPKSAFPPDRSFDDLTNFSFEDAADRNGWLDYPYIVRFRLLWEADEDDSLKYHSMAKVVQRKMNTANLKEMLLLGDFLYWKYHKRIDTKSITLCNSVFSDGYAAGVIWDSRAEELQIGPYWPGNAGGNLRPREVAV